MSTAKEKLMRANEAVTIDCAEIGMHLPRTTVTLLLQGTEFLPIHAPFVAFAQTIRECMAAQFPQNRGMDRKDTKQYAPWLDILDAEDTPTAPFDVTRGMVEWLYKHVDEAKVRPAIAQWREAVADYLQDLVKE